ncbi:MAG: phage holin family protein [Gemmataceae bacterium]
MSSNLQTHPEVGADPGLSALLTGIFHDIQELLKQQMQLFKHEVSADVKNTAEAAISMVVGGAVALVGGAMLCFMLVYILHELAHLPLWGSFGLVGLAFLVIGAALALYGRSRFRSFNPLPDESLAALKENLEWTTKPR